MTSVYDPELVDVIAPLMTTLPPDPFMDFLIYCIDALEDGRTDCVPNPSAASLLAAAQECRS